MSNSRKSKVKIVDTKSSLRATCWCVCDDHHWLDLSISSFSGLGQPVLVVSDTAWDGTAADNAKVIEIASQTNAKVVLGTWSNESDHRRAALEILLKMGFRDAFIPDSDEVLSPDLAANLLRVAEADLADRLHVQMDTYWKDRRHVIRPRERLEPIIYLRLGTVQHAFCREYDGGRRLLLDSTFGVLHHLSYAGSDSRIERKVTTWGHRDEVVSNWFEGVWLGWNADPTLQNLHPTHPEAYRYAQPIKMPMCLVRSGEDSDIPVVDRPSSWPTVSVVIPLYGGPDDIRQCLESLAECKDLIHELIVVDDCSPDGAALVVREFSFATLQSHASNLGFAAACNTGIRACIGEAVVLLNSDTVVPRVGLIELVQSLFSSGSVGASGPLTNAAGYYQRLSPTYESLDGLDTFASDIAKSGANDRDVDMLVGFCLAIRRSVLMEVGLLDESFGQGLFEDTDLCYRIQRAGYRLRLAGRAFVHHWGSRSLERAKVNSSQLLRHNGKVFSDKWRCDIESGFAPYLPGFELRDGPIRFDQNCHPDISARALANRVRLANISLCMIVRNEERVLRDCLLSARRFFSQVVVLDTGSEDRTVEIARELGCEVHETRWQNSFAVARNESITYARGKWIFWLDADDTLDYRSGAGIVEAAITAAENVVAFTVPVQFVDEGPGAGTRVDHVKLIRNLPGVEFTYHIHEQVLPSLRPLGEIVELSGPVVMHSGYDTSAEGQARKRERDWQLLALDLAERPDDPFVHFNIGMTHHFGGSHLEAVASLKRSIELSKGQESTLRKAYVLLGNSLANLGDPTAAMEAYDAGLAKVGMDPELAFKRAQLLSELGRLAEARQAYESIPNELGSHFKSVDIGIVGFKRDHNLAAVCWELGDYAAAKHYWTRSIEVNPKFSQSALSLFDAALAARDQAQANACVAHLLQHNGPDEYWASCGEKLELRFSGPAAAEAWLRQACHNYPRAAGPALCLSRLLCRTGRELVAEPMLVALAEAGYAEAAFMLGVTSNRKSDLEAALKWFEKAALLNPGHPGTREQIRLLSSMLGLETSAE